MSTIDFFWGVDIFIGWQNSCVIRLPPNVHSFKESSIWQINKYSSYIKMIQINSLNNMIIFFIFVKGVCSCDLKIIVYASRIKLLSSYISLSIILMVPSSRVIWTLIDEKSTLDTFSWLRIQNTSKFPKLRGLIHIVVHPFNLI